MNRCLQVLLLAALAVLAAGCDVTPMGRQQLILLPADYMNDMGRQAFDAMKQTEPVITDEVSSRRVQCIADHITRVAPDLYPAYARGNDWEVVLFDNPTANAFAMPGNKIGVFTGLLDVADNDDQLAAVMGHEVAHLLANHGNERMTQELGISAVLLLIGLFTEIDSQLALQALGLGAHIGVSLPFSRVHESEADILGLNLMAAAGFDPAESVSLWENMAANAGDGPYEFLSTHPGHDTRIENLRSHLEIARQFSGKPVSCS